MHFRCFKIAFFAICLIPLAALSQAGPETIDVRPFAPTQGSSIDQVSIANGSLQLNISIAAIKQRGRLKLDFSLRYDGPTFTLLHDCFATSGTGSPASQPSSRSNGLDTPAGTQLGANPAADQSPACNPPVPCKSDTHQICDGGYALTGTPVDAILGTRRNVRFTASTDLAILGVITSWDGAYPHTGYWALYTPDLGMHSLGPTTSGQYRAGDGTGWAYQPSTCTLLDGDGTRYVFTCSADNTIAFMGGHRPGHLMYEEDTNGNRITLVLDSNGNFLKWIDTLGRTISPPSYSATTDPRCPSGSSGSQTFPVPGVSDPAVLCEGTVAFHSHFFPADDTNVWVVDGYTEAQGTLSTLTGIILPTGHQWKFNYTPQLGDPEYGTQYNYADLTRIDLPTGGAIRYTWASPARICNISIVAAQLTTERRQIAQKTMSPDGATWATWSYQLASILSASPGSNYQVTVVDPLSNKQVHQLTDEGNCSLFDTSVSYFDSGNTLIETQTTDFTVLPYFTGGPGEGALPTKIQTIWSGGSTKGTVYTYDSGFTGEVSIYDSSENVNVPYGLETTRLDYSYGNNTLGTLLATTVTDYWALHNGSALSNNILEAPITVTVTDPVTNAKQITNYGYDESALTSGNAPSTASDGTTIWNATPPNGGVRGNQTSVSRYVDSTSYLTSTIDYNDTGTVHALHLPSNTPFPETVTTYSWSATYAGGAMTERDDSVGNAITYTYDPDTLQPTSEKDANQQTTTYSYYGDSRLKAVILPASSYGQRGETDYSYPNATEVDTSVKQSSAQSVERRQLFDGLGRAVRAILVNGCSANDDRYADMSYDLLGRVLTETNPYCANESNMTDGVVTTGYDAIGRPTIVTMQDGVSTQKWAYNGPTTTFTNELGAGHSWSRTEDGLGRLAVVVEPGSLSTSYGYNAFGDLTSVNQTGKAGDTARSRTFVYDLLSRLKSATNPETGTVAYTYDAHGNVLSKTTPAVNGTSGTQVIGYCHDALNRITAKLNIAPSASACSTPSAGQILASYGYDTSSVGGSSNTKGRLTDEKSYAGNTLISERQLYSYDSMGRLLNENQITFKTGSSNTTFSPAYRYDLAGNLVASTDGATPIQGVNSTFPCTPDPSVSGWTNLAFVNCYDGVGRVTSVTSNWADMPTGMFTVGTTNGFFPGGQLKQWTQGPILSVTQSFIPRLWLNGITATGQVP